MRAKKVFLICLTCDEEIYGGSVPLDKTVDAPHVCFKCASRIINGAIDVHARHDKQRTRS